MNHIITISRQHGSGGREIGALVSKKLGIPYYDNDLIQLAAEKSGFSEEHFRDYDKFATNSFLYSLVRGFQYHQNATGVWSLEDKIYTTQSKVIRELAEKEPCIIIGRCADYVLSDMPGLVKLFIYGALDARAERVAKKENITSFFSLSSKCKKYKNYLFSSASKPLWKLYSRENLPCPCNLIV